MKRQIKILILIIYIVFFPCPSLSAPYYGVHLSYGLIGLEPETIKGYQLILNYDPQYFTWRQFNVYFDSGFSHFWVTSTAYYSYLDIYAFAPVIRYTFRKHWLVLPYFELSIGLAYLNHTRLDNRNLGIHLAFQDRLGAGIFLGNSERLSFGLHAVHYSNAHLSSHNSGITLPLVLDISYRF